MAVAPVSSAKNLRIVFIVRRWAPSLNWSLNRCRSKGPSSKKGSPYFYGFEGQSDLGEPSLFEQTPSFISAQPDCEGESENYK
jgi:hypothetical protein